MGWTLVLGELPARVRGAGLPLRRGDLARGASKVDDSKVACPVLVVAGAQDHITPASVVRKVARKYKAVSTYKEFENHAHWVIGEPGWQEIADYIADWLKQVLPQDI